MRASQLVPSSRAGAASTTRPNDGLPLDYLAKDYESFRQLIADRLAYTLPEWSETHAPDEGVAILELLAYVGDQLSYFQDAAAGEAYIATARQRPSIRRHARLIAYRLHEGCNARVWLSLKATNGDLELDPGMVVFATGERAGSPRAIIHTIEHDESELAGRQVFEPLSPGPGGVVRVRVAHNAIQLEDPLAGGATCARLRSTGPRLELQPGEVLIVEELSVEERSDRSPLPGCAVDTTRRQAVRLTNVRHEEDGSLQVRWDDVDALRFSLEATRAGAAGGGGIARGNIVLAHHGRLLAGDTGRWCQGGPLGGRYRRLEPISSPDWPAVSAQRLSYASPAPHDEPAALALRQDPDAALPRIAAVEWHDVDAASTALAPSARRVVSGIRIPHPEDDGESFDAFVAALLWEPRHDLLASGRNDRHFVVEHDNQGSPHLRFGDGVHGRRPSFAAPTRLAATYHEGNGSAGNVAAESICWIGSAAPDDAVKWVSVRNPLPAEGGTEPQSHESARRLAPLAITSGRRRAARASDYADLVLHDRALSGLVHSAAAELRWRGSRYEAVVAIDALGRDRAGPRLLGRVAGALAPARTLGRDLRVVEATHVRPLIAVALDLEDSYDAADVLERARSELEPGTTADGRPGFFSPDRWVLGQAVHLSPMVAALQGVAGVVGVSVQLFRRPDARRIDGDVATTIELGPLEIVSITPLAAAPLRRGPGVIDLAAGSAV